MNPYFLGNRLKSKPESNIKLHTPVTLRTIIQFALNNQFQVWISPRILHSGLVKSNDIAAVWPGSRDRANDTPYLMEWFRDTILKIRDKGTIFMAVRSINDKVQLKEFSSYALC